MFRDAGEANQQHVDALQREVDRLAAENDAMRSQILTAGQRGRFDVSLNAYQRDANSFSAGERAALGVQRITPFPVWAAVTLHIVTLGLFSLVHFNRLHDQMVAAASDDPSTVKGVGYSFIPYFHFYWVVFNTMRLVDRLELQYKLRGRRSTLPRGLIRAAAVVSTIPYLNITVGVLLWIFGVYAMQHTANEVAAMEPIGETLNAETLRVDATVTASANDTLPEALAEVPASGVGGLGATR